MASGEPLNPLDPAYRVARLEKQLEAFERLHHDELGQLGQQLETYKLLHEDEVKLLRDEITDLREELENRALGGGEASAGPANSPEEAAEQARRLSRRQFLTGGRSSSGAAPAEDS